MPSTSYLRHDRRGCPEQVSGMTAESLAQPFRKMLAPQSKTPAEQSAGALACANFRRSWKDVAVEANPEHPFALVLDLVDAGGQRGSRAAREERSPCIRRLQLPVHHVETDIHRRREVVLRTRADHPDAPIVGAIADPRIGAERIDRRASPSAWSAECAGGIGNGLLRADRVVGRAVVFHPPV